jgi:serine/threonine protein kinase
MEERAKNPRYSEFIRPSPIEAGSLAVPMAIAAAPEIPGFAATSPLGFGPTSTIYSAQSLSLGRWVALTVYATHLPDERSQRRFRRGYEMARRLGTHPHAVTVLDFGLTTDHQPFVATEIYERGTLEGRLEGRLQPSSVAEALHMGIALAGALETAHRADVIHGGVHPARVLLGADGQPALADLGLVPLVDRGGLAALLGPMAYHSPPEVLEGGESTPATDVYSLASTLHTALTGHAPYAGAGSLDDDSTPSLLLRVLQHDVPAIGRTDVPPSLEQVLRQALSCEPRDRPARPLALAQTLQRCQQEVGLPVTQPIVLDVAASLSVAADPDPDSYASPPPTPAPPPPAAAPAAPPEDTVERVFIPYPAPPMERPTRSVLADYSLQPSAPPIGPEPPVMPPPVVEPPARPVLAPQVVLVPPKPVVVAPRPGTQPSDRPDPAKTGRARALPVVVLGLLVAVIFAGVTWSIVTGESSEDDRVQPHDGALGDNSQRQTATQSGLTAVENATGVQLDWDGRDRSPHVVVELSTVAPPRILPANPGSALLIPNTDLDPNAGYCFAVVKANAPLPSPAELAAAIPDEALGSEACIRSGSLTTVLRQ